MNHPNNLKYCSCGNPSEKQVRRTGLIVYRGICTQCLIRKRRNIPDYINEEWIRQKHIEENLSLEQIAKLLDVRESHVFYFFKLYNIKEIKHCRYCNATENLRNGIVNNNMMEAKESTHKICQSCYEKVKSESGKEGQKKVDKKASVEKRKLLYVEDPDKKKREIERCKQTIANRTEEEHNEWKQNLSISKQNRTEEEKALSTLKLQETINTMSKEEREQWLRNMGNGVSEAYWNKSEEERKMGRKVYEYNCEQQFGVPYNPIGLSKMHEANRNKSPEEKQEILDRMEETFKRNRSRHCRIYSISHKATSLFIKVDEYFNNKYPFEYCIYDRVIGKYIKRERGVYVGDLHMSNNKYRFFDFYFKYNNVRIAIEFDEYGHSSPKQIQSDLLRESEIFIKKPDLYLFRIPEAYYDNNFDVMFNDIINLLENLNYETILNYDCLTKKVEKEKLLISK